MVISNIVGFQTLLPLFIIKERYLREENEALVILFGVSRHNIPESSQSQWSLFDLPIGERKIINNRKWSEAFWFSSQNSQNHLQFKRRFQRSTRTAAPTRTGL